VTGGARDRKRVRRLALLAVAALGLVWCAPSRVAAAGPQRGVDVSSWQGSIDWSAVAGSGISFAYIRAALGGTTSDVDFLTNWHGATKAGVVTGAYLYFVPSQDPHAQANLLIQQLRSAGFAIGNVIPAIDVERTDGQPAAVIVSELHAVIDDVQAAIGALPAIYTSPAWWDGNIGSSDFISNPLWVANWCGSCSAPSMPANNWGGHGYQAWQYADNGKVPGISTNVDLDQGNAGPPWYGGPMWVSQAPQLAGVEGTDSAVWVSPGGGVGFVTLAGTVIAAPAIAWVPSGPASTDGAYLFVVTGTDHSLWTRTLSTGFTRLAQGLYCVDNPAIVVSGSVGSLILTVACEGADGSLWYAQSAPGGLSANQNPNLADIPWRSLGGRLAAGPSAASLDGSAMTFMVTGTDSHVYTITNQNAAGVYAETPWRCIGHPALGAATSHSFFGCHGLDGHLWYAVGNGAAFSPPVSAGGRLVDGIGVATLTNGSSTLARFFVEGADNHLWETTVATDGSQTGFSYGGGVLIGGVGAA
jgi:lysozyme